MSEHAQRHDADALIIGRRAPTAERRLIRLGRVARRLCRRLPRPVIVVPPDLRAPDIGGGPVLLATSLESDSDAAAAFARSVAKTMNRRIVVVHIVSAPDSGMIHAPMTAGLRGSGQLEIDARRDLEGWMGPHGLSRCDVVVAAGDPIDRIADVAAAEHCPIIVCGSRLLGLAPRVLISSVGSSLAATAACPTAVVPPLAQPVRGSRFARTSVDLG